MKLTYGSVCSGIEAASVAWEPLGMKPLWFAEVEPFPSAVLAHHWPDVPNVGDMTRIADMIRSGDLTTPDVLVGGTPCQSFSVAGARRGLEDPRGQLTLSFVDLANAIDQKRAADGIEPCIIVWENVPGVLSGKGNAFGCFLGALSDAGDQLQPSGKRWTNAGVVSGPQRTVAWRTLDAQYFGVAQRRRRVFVVASARAGFDPTEVLFESEGVRRDTPPRRESGEGFAADVAPSLVRSGRGVERIGETRGQDPVVAVPILEPGARRYTLQAGKNHGVAQAVALVGREGGGTAELRGGLSPTLRAASGGGDKPHVLTAYNVHENQRAEVTLSDTAGSVKCAGGKPGQGYPAALTVHGTKDPIVGDNLSHAPGRNNGQENSIFHGLAVRRLTPTECERLQGFPDGHTDVSYRNKPACDGPRYKAIGNSMAVPCMAWIGSRINRNLNRGR